MSLGKSIGKTVVLIILIIILILAGLLWFDYLGVIQSKKIFAPLYKMFGLTPQSSVSVQNVSDGANLDLDEARLEKRLEELEIRTQELDLRESVIAEKEAVNNQMSEELEDRRISQEEREKTFNNIQKKYDDRDVNIGKNAQNLNGMAPANAVAILLAMDDQDMIDTLRKVDEIAEQEGKSSMVSYWMSLMPPERVAQIQRKMTVKPNSLE